MSDELHSTITHLLTDIASGDQGAQDRLFERVYDEIRRSAAYLLGKERKDHTLQPTALVAEVYLKLFSKGTFDAPNRAYFYGAVARAMRQILVDHARKRGSDCVPLDDVLVWLKESQQINVLDLNEALEELERLNPRHFRVVTQRFFAGRQMEEIAQDEGCSLSTIEKDWKFARAWLRRRLQENTREA